MAKIKGEGGLRSDRESKNEAKKPNERQVKLSYICRELNK